MTMQDKVAMFDISQLVLHPSNPRQNVSQEYIDDLADNLVEFGLIQNLCGVPMEDGKIGIVAGGCRLRALPQAISERPDLNPIPVKIAPDITTAQEWAVVENTLRRGLKAAAMVRQSKLLKDRGRPIAEIARLFALPINVVKQYLALAELPNEVIDALDAEKISFDQAKALTLAPTAQRMLEALKSVVEDGLQDYQIRRLFTGSISSTDGRVQFVGLDRLATAGCEIISDLFNDSTTLKGEDIIDAEFASAMASYVDRLRENEGWKWVEFMDVSAAHYINLPKLQPDLSDLSEEEAAEFTELDAKRWNRTKDEDSRFAELKDKRNPHHSAERKALTGTVLYFNYNGSLEAVSGYVRKDDLEAVYAAGWLERPEEKDTDKDTGPTSAYSQALADDLNQIRLLALMEEVQHRPELALDVLAFSLSHFNQHFRAPTGITCNFQNKLPAKSDGLNLSETVQGGEDYIRSTKDSEPAFDEFQAKGKKHRNMVLAQHVARSLSRFENEKGALGPVLEGITGSHMRKVWTPNKANLFGRVSAAYLDDLFADLLGLKASDQRLKDFKAMKKGPKADRMEEIFANSELDQPLGITPEQRAAIDLWTPDMTK